MTTTRTAVRMGLRITGGRSTLTDMSQSWLTPAREDKRAGLAEEGEELVVVNDQRPQA
jgi:hypothetical protein